MKIDADKLLEIRTQQTMVMRADAESMIKRARLQYLVTTTLAEAGELPDRGICLECGCIHRQGKPCTCDKED